MEITRTPGAFLSRNDRTKCLFVDVTVANLMVVGHFVSSTEKGGHAFWTVRRRENRTCYIGDVLISLPTSVQILRYPLAATVPRKTWAPTELSRPIGW